MSRQELAEKVGVNHQTIGFIERGDYFPSLELAFKIAAAFDVEITTVFRINHLNPFLLNKEVTMPKRPLTSDEREVKLNKTRKLTEQTLAVLFVLVYFYGVIGATNMYY